MAVAAPPRPPAAVAVASPVTAYAEAVVRGERVVGRLVRLACERHLSDLETGPARGLVFDAAAADKAIGFFRLLRHSKGEWAGQPFTLADWQQFIVGSLFGWKRADGTRRFRTSYKELARKNGKTTLMAGIGLLLAFFDGEGGAEVYAAATKREQAKICWGEARRMVLATPSLRQRIDVRVGNLNNPLSASKFEPLGADGDSMDGLNISGAVVDELHAHKTRAIVDVLETATSARQQPLINYITTAGSDRQSVCWSHHQYSVRVLEGTVQDDTWFAFIACLDESDDWQDPAVWPKANPNLGVSVKPDDLQRKAARAKQIPSEQNAFRRLHCGVWTEQTTRWIDVAVWDQAEAQRPLDELEGRRCYGGLDLASTTDLAAFALWFPDEGSDGGDLHLWCWAPEEGIRLRAERDRAPYPVWEQQGLLTATEGNVTDYDVIRDEILGLAERFEIAEIAYDPWNATQLATQLGNEGAVMVPHRQGFASLAGPTREFKRLVLGRGIRHGDHPILRWAFVNMVVRTDPAGNEKPDKEKATERIDPIVASIMAVGRSATHAQDGEPSIRVFGPEDFEDDEPEPDSDEEE